MEQKGGRAQAGNILPFSRAVEAGGWLKVSGQTPMRDGEVVEGSIIEQSRIAIENCIEYYDRGWVIVLSMWYACISGVNRLTLLSVF